MKERILNIPTNSSGIYIYYFRNTGKDDCEQSYVGSTTNFKKRHSEHVQALRNNNHSNFHFQNAYNKYGDSNLEYEQLEQMIFPNNYDKQIKRDYLESREFYWYQLLGSKFNLVTPGESIINSLQKRGKYVFKANKRLVYLVDKEFNIICEYEGVREAARKLNLQSTAISKVARVKQEHSKGLFFRYEEFLGKSFDKKSLKGIEGKPRKELRKPVLCYNLGAEKISEYDSIAMAAKLLNLHKSGIIRCCKGEANCTGKYIFRFKKSSIPIKEVKKKKQFAVMSFKDGIFYKEFANCNQAALFFNLGRGLIHYKCNNSINNSIGNLKFSYKE